LADGTTSSWPLSRIAITGKRGRSRVAGLVADGALLADPHGLWRGAAFPNELENWTF
jgi:hypothetical protein